MCQVCSICTDFQIQIFSLNVGGCIGMEVKGTRCSSIYASRQGMMTYTTIITCITKRLCVGNGLPYIIAIRSLVSCQDHTPHGEGFATFLGTVCKIRNEILYPTEVIIVHSTIQTTPKGRSLL